MALRTTNRNFQSRDRNIKYINKDFSAFKSNLIEFTKTYFPKTFNDFSEASPGMMFIELSSYIGDVLSYYIDDTFKESLLPYADDKKSVINIAQSFGYKPKVTSPSITTLSVYQLVPSIGSGTDNKPDERYFLKIRSGMRCLSSSGITFITTDRLDFSDPTDREIDIYQRDAETAQPTFYLIKKQVQAISAEPKEQSFEFGTYEAFQSIELNETNIIEVYDVRDADGNKYYEVPYLGQEMVFIDFPNTESNDPELSQFRDTVPYVLKTIRTARRFTTKINEDDTTTIQFGSGDASSNDELLIPNLKNVGLGLPNSIKKLDESFDPTNFLKTKTYGISPANTKITVKYYTGGGVGSNVPKGTITQLNGVEYEEDLNTFTQQELSVYTTIKNSLSVDNEIPATGGRNGETVEEIRQNALATFGSQNRAVTAKDYQVRVLSMPSKYGSVAKAYAVADGNLDNNSPSSILASPNNLEEFTNLVLDFVNLPDDEEPNKETIQRRIKDYLIGKADNKKEKNNPFAVNLYLLGYDVNGKLTNVNRALKENLKTYLNEYRILTDGVNFIDGFIINIGVEFEIVCYQNYNKTEVVTNCISEITQFFNIDNWGFNQTINLSELELLIANVEGVSSVPMVKITNKCGGKYSPNSYNIEAATKDKIVYPSLDPSVFEVKYPGSDIIGRAR